LEGEFGVHVAAVIAGGMRQLGVAALRTAHVMNRLERVVGAALALAGFAVALNRKHGCFSLLRAFRDTRGNELSR